jgi:hypothetical protein
VSTLQVAAHKDIFFTMTEKSFFQTWKTTVFCNSKDRIFFLPCWEGFIYIFSTLVKVEFSFFHTMARNKFFTLMRRLSSRQ